MLGRLCALLLLVATSRLTSGFDIPLLSSSTADLDKWATRAEKLVDNVSPEDLERWQLQSEAIVKEGRKSLAIARQFAKANAHAIELVAGALMTFWGKNIMHLLLFVQTFRLSGWVPFRQAAVDLVHEVSNATEVIRKEAPNLLVARDALRDIRAKKAAIEGRVERVRAAAKSPPSWFSATVTEEDVRAEVAKAQEEIAALVEQAHSINAATSFWRKLSASIDPLKLRLLLMPIWTSITACIATATSPNAAALTTSFGMGGDVAAAVRGIIFPLLERGRKAALRMRQDVLSSPKLSPSQRKWVDSALTIGARLGTVWLSFQYSELSLLFSGSLLGARLLVGTFNKLGLQVPEKIGSLDVDSLCGDACVEKQPWWRPFAKQRRRQLELKEGSSLYTIVISALAAAGFLSQSLPGTLAALLPAPPAFSRGLGDILTNNLFSRAAHFVLWVVKTPLIWLDDYFEAMSIAARMSASGLFKGLLPKAPRL